MASLMLGSGRTIRLFQRNAVMETASPPITNAEGRQCSAARAPGTGSERAMESAESSGRDRRRNERFVFDGFAEVVSYRPEVLFRGAVRDISLTGCYVETRA